MRFRKKNEKLESESEQVECVATLKQPAKKKGEK